MGTTSDERVHWQDKPELRDREFVNESWGQWVALCVLMSSFAILINNTGSLNHVKTTKKNEKDPPTGNRPGEPKVATYMISLAILIMLLTTPLYLMQRWNSRSRYMTFVTGFISLALVVAFLWLLLRIWFDF